MGEGAYHASSREAAFVQHLAGLGHGRRLCVLRQGDQLL
jgi:hypothetical protein